MQILYLNNFRGFSKTFIQLKEVNFLLGENSTGKTSILSILNLLSKPQFWFSQEFNNEEIELGYFSEILSINADNDFFEVALFDSEPQNKVEAFYMKFTEEEGSPFLSEYKFMLANKNVFIFRTKEGIKYQAEKINQSNKNKELLQVFREWIDKISLKKSQSKSHLLPLNTKVPLFVIQDLVSNEIQGKESSKKTIDGNNLPIFFKDLTWIAPIRVKPKRNYDGYKVNFSSEGEHIPYILKSIILNTVKENAQPLKEDLEKFGSSSGLFEKLSIKTLGEDKTAPFEIHIVLNGMPLKITNVGYGVSQILPIIVEVLAGENGSCFAIQQPEVHIHPRGQAALGELLFHLAKQENKTFIVETHSDFIVDRYRITLKKYNKRNDIKESNAQVLFFERTENGNVVHHIEIDERGEYSDNQPESFRAFFIKEELEMLSY